MASGNTMKNGVHSASGPRLNDGNEVASGVPLENGASLAASDGAADAEKSPLRHWQETQISVEKLRIQLGNRLSALTRGVDQQVKPVPAEYQEVMDEAVRMEESIDRAIARELLNWPVYEAWLCHVKGIGPSLAGQLLSMLLPPKPEYGPSSWFKAAGLTTSLQPDGLYRLPRDRKDAPATHHRYLRRCLHNVATSFVRGGGYYRRVYEVRKARLTIMHASDADHWPPHRLDSTARWITVKRFLSHLWEAWCESDGIHNRGPYGLTTLADGTRVLRFVNADGSYQDHAYEPAPRWNGREKI